MKLTTLSISGLRGTDRSIDLAPVTVWTGPNGGGKTSAVGAIAYALTGRFPGMIGEHADDLLPLATDRKAGFSVELQGEHRGVEVWLSRGVDREGVNFLKVSDGRSQSKGILSAKHMLASLTGEVQWFIDAFDAEKSVWRLSTEKRKEWALELCAGASGWPKERLTQELGPASDFWDPSANSDAARCLDMNLNKLGDRIRATQKLVREAKVIADGVSVETGAAAKVEAAEKSYEAARAEATRLDKRVEQSKQAQARADKAQRDRQNVTQQVDRAREAVRGLIPPRPPLRPESTPRLETMEDELFSMELQSEDVLALVSRVAPVHANLQHEVVRLTEEQRIARSEQRCALCETVNPQLAPFQRRLDAAQRALETQGNELSLATAQAAKMQAEEDKLRREIEQRRAAIQTYQREHEQFREAMYQFESTWTTALTALQTLEANLAKLPEEAPVADLAKLEAELATARSTESTLKAALNSARAALGVVHERDGQLKASREATIRLEELKDFQEKVRVVRDRMLDDAVDPLRSALAQLDALAHDRGHWDIRREGRELDIGWTDGRRFLPATSLSTGEKYRATVALLVARQMVQREPFAGLFLDNFECVYPGGERDGVIAALVIAASAGFVDNVFLAGACTPPDVMGAKIYELGQEFT